jgi:glycosyltransferase involved in cell wall biosynthesis
MRIGINGLLLSSEAGYRQSGIDRYLRGLLSALPEALAHHHPTRSVAIHGEPSQAAPVAMNGDATREKQSALIVYAGAGAIEPEGRFEVHEVPSFVTNRALRIPWEQFGLPRAIATDRLDLFHGTAFALPARLPVPGVVTIHDLAFLRWPEQVPRRRALYLARAVTAATKRARRVIAVSEATKHDVVELLGVDPVKIDVTPLGVDSRFQRAPGEAIVEFRQRNELIRPFVLAVGTREPRKNLPALIEAFARVKDEISQDLVHAGGAGWLPDELDRAIAEAKLGDRLRFVDFVPHDELPLWYSAADCFIMPSLYEGFGLPLLEAMACGTPAIASNRSSLPEVAGDAAYLCEPDADSIAVALTTVLHDGELRQRLHEAGPNRAKAFTWQRTAALTVGSYRRAIDDR